MEQKCVRCGEPATVNIQKLWIEWKYDHQNNDEYSQKHELLDIEPVDSENLHLCGRCEDLWKGGEI